MVGLMRRYRLRLISLNGMTGSERCRNMVKLMGSSVFISNNDYCGDSRRTVPGSMFGTMM